MKYDCVVIGGGAAGLMAAINTARAGLKTAVIEHTKKIGNKILSTGNGKCNFTNLNMSEEMYLNSDKRFVKEIIEQFNENDTIDFFESIGVYHKDKNGYVYPHSETAASVQEALCLEIERLGVKVFLETSVSKIKKNDKDFLISCNDKDQSVVICSKTIILATGSKAASKTGSDGSGYELARQMKHTIVSVLPALCQLISSNKNCKLSSGVRSTGEVKLFIDNIHTADDLGEVQYTDYGISGIPVFQISRFAVKGISENKKVAVCIDMVPDMQEYELIKKFNQRLKNESEKNILQFMSGLVNKKLIEMICRDLNISTTKQVHSLPPKSLAQIVKSLKNYKYAIKDYKGFENAQVCQGGIDLKEISSKDMQSRIVPGLFIAGEVADVDGKCGGYNLQWAWSSGYIAAKGVKAFVKTDKK